jgi:phage/plasmid primase-like uncharacterized protein
MSMSRLERIVAACGGILLDNGSRALIPGPDHSHQDRSVSLMETEDGRILIHCFSPRDDWREVRRALMQKGLLREGPDDANAPSPAPRPTIAAQPASEDRIARAQRIWNEGRPIQHTPATIYLRTRAIAEEKWSCDGLRFHPRMTSLDDRTRRPALLAALTNAAGEVQGVQATLLTQHGTAKAPVPTPRRVIGKLIGGAVRLAEPMDELAVGEGVETMLSASAALGLPAWAALTAGNLALFDPPIRVKRLVVAVDNDAAGQAALEKLRLRLSTRLRVDAAAPPDGADDWNDFARAGQR